MNGYLLDTNVASAMIREPRGLASAYAASRRHSGLALSLVTAGELQFGVRRIQGARWANRVEEFLARIPVLPINPPADQMYAELRASLERVGAPIGNNDLWLAAHALALDRTLVTANLSEFNRVRGLRVENWLVQP